LRNPVAAISAVSDMFQMVGIADDRLRSASNILHRQVQALGATLERMVDLSALLFGDVQLARAPVAIADVLSGVLRDLGPRLQEKGVTVEMQPTDARTFVLGDATRLAQLFDSLLQHALKLSKPPKPLQIAVSVEERHVAVSLTDHGPGFEVSPMPNAAGSHGSMNVPLMVASAIAELHQGSVAASSAGPGQGATMTVTLPLMASGAGPTQHGAGPASAQKARMRVLAIEDNRDFAQLFRHMLEIMGCDLDITSDARSGLVKARDTLPQLIFCDIGLPGDMDGFAFARAVRADPLLAHVPLVAVSGYNSPADVQRALDAGFNRVCGKPVKFADISAALAAFSAQRPA
jgi:CheY-like chemotaxis protein